MNRLNILLLIPFLSLSNCVEISNSESNSNNTSSESEEIIINNSITSIDATDKEEYKAMVNRDAITYSEEFINDNNVDIEQIEVFQINDTHGAYYDGDDITGISRVATCIKENTTNPYGVVKIGNGDLLQGTAFSNMLLG